MSDDPVSGNFTVVLWIQVPVDRAGAAGGLASKFDPASRTGFNLSAISSAGGYSSVSDELRISFGIDAGCDPQWFDLGRPSPTSNYVSNSLTVFDGSIHAGTTDAPREADRAHVFRYAGGTEWDDLGKVGREDAHGVGPMVVHRGALFAATWNYDWTRVHSQDLQPCRVYRYDGPGKWEDCGQPGASRRLFSLASFRGDLYVVGADSTIHKYRGGTSWEKVHGFETFAHPMTIYDGRLILGMLHPATVWAFDGQDWQDLGNPLGDPERCNETHSLVTFHGALHVGTWPLGRVARWDPAAGRWRQVGRLGDSSEIMALNVYNGKLYGAAIPRAEVFRYEHNGSWTSLHRFFRPKGWRPVRVDNMRREPDGDRRMREWTRVTSLTQHDGLMFASIGSCTAAAADAAADIRGSVQAFSAGTTCTTLHSLTPGWHHIAARRSGGTIFLFVDGHAVAAKHGDLNRSIATDVSLRVGEDESGPYTSGIEAFQLVERALDDAEIRQLAQDIRPSLRATPTEEGLR